MTDNNNTNKFVKCFISKRTKQLEVEAYNDDNCDTDYTANQKANDD